MTPSMPAMVGSKHACDNGENIAPLASSENELRYFDSDTAPEALR